MRTMKYPWRFAAPVLMSFFVMLHSLFILSPAHAAGITADQLSYTVDGKKLTCKVVRVPLADYRVKVGLAQGQVGATQGLADIAKRYGAVAAINGCFFDAYTTNVVKPPYHNLVADGDVIHMGDTGVTLGFDADGNYRMERVRFKLEGQTAGPGGKSAWYAYLVNHPAETASAAILYTKTWVGGKSPAAGRQVVVADGTVQTVTGGGQALPAAGYVLLFSGGDEYLAGRFQPGAKVSYRMTIAGGDAAFWGKAREALGCGPRLVQDGAVAVDPKAEGFSSAKILTLSCARSAVGVTKNRTLLIVTCPSATIGQLARIMLALGAQDAMNLDGGASSSLWYDNRYLTAPGRDVSNALVIVKK